MNSEHLPLRNTKRPHLPSAPAELSDLWLHVLANPSCLSHSWNYSPHTIPEGEKGCLKGNWWKLCLKKKNQRKWLKTNPKDSAPSSEGWDLKMPKSCSRPQWTQRGQLCFRFKRHFTEQSSATILNMHTGKVVWISAVRYNCDYVS